MIGAARVRQAIVLSRQTQKEVAESMGISEQYLSDICNGRRAVSAFVAVRLESVLGVDAHKVLIDQVLEELKQAREEYAPILEATP